MATTGEALSSAMVTSSSSSSADDSVVSTAASSQVSVVVRVRSLTRQEVGLGGKSVVQAADREIRLGQRRFTYDRVFDEQVGQEELYQAVSAPLLRVFLDGYNATIMAYGQTGSGKTFTMGSEAHTDLQVSENTGLIPRFMKELLQHLHQRTSSGPHGADDEAVWGFQLQASFLEVYGEDVHDLLDPLRPSLPLREDAHGGIVCPGLTHREVHSAEQALAVLHEGTLNRTTAATLMNLTSSRSHAVFTITLKQGTRRASQPHDALEVTTVVSRFTFVDLAGSERMKKTGAEGERAREGIKINEGLLALGNVINALADEERLAEGKKIHVPYRQSKLTRLLQDALGGNSQTLFVACVSPSDTNASETLSTLHYANRARNIKNALVKNVDAHQVELQRLQAYNRTLQRELVKLHFSDLADEILNHHQHDESEEPPESVLWDTLMKQPVVMEYLHQLEVQAQDCQQAPPLPAGKLLPSPASQSLFQSAAQMLTSPRRPLRASVPTVAAAEQSPSKKAHLVDMDPTLLSEVNPDEDLAILDHLLELQQRDQEHDKEKKSDDAKIKEVEGELAEQEALLLQLRDNLKVYHNIKVRYEILMAEVQQLESEKAQLADKLEKASVDPTQGCSSSIRKELEKVEKSLSRARNETRKHRQMYKKAEQEAQKCRALERKISELKTGRVALMKKQKEAVARHREYTEAKTREIMALKKRERTQEAQVSKLQREVQLHKKNLEKRQDYCNKLTKKLKETESHLMKLLSLRKRELHDRTSTIGMSRRQTVAVATIKPVTVADDDPESEDFLSLKFLLEKEVADRVTRSELQHHFEERVEDYGEAMRKMVATVKRLEEARRDSHDCQASTPSNQKELEQSVEELELKTELAGADLESIRAQLRSFEEHAWGTDGNLTSLLEGKSASLLRHLLFEYVDKYTETEVQKKKLAECVARKDSALHSFESEVEALNANIAVLTRERADRIGEVVDSQASNERLRALEKKEHELVGDLEKLRLEYQQQSFGYHELEARCKSLELDLARTCERVAVLTASLKDSSGVREPEQQLLETQRIWEELGISLASREEYRRQMDNCLEITCKRQYEEAKQMKADTEKQIEHLRLDLTSKCATLGQTLDSFTCIDNEQPQLIARLEKLKAVEECIAPLFAQSLSRRDGLVQQVLDLSTSLDMKINSLPSILEELVKKPPLDVGALSEPFLNSCEGEVSALRIVKAEILATGAVLVEQVRRHILEMNLGEGEILSLVERSLKQRDAILPDWWDSSEAEKVVRSCCVNGNVISPSQSFSNHLRLVSETLSRVAAKRREFSTGLRAIVEKAQKTLLKAVDGEITASEAYSSFHDALFRLPELSMERIQACLTEIEALTVGVNSMTKSEIEALTVVWEALNVSAADRGKFWGDVEDSVASMGSFQDSPFDQVALMSSVDAEDWIHSAVDRYTKIYKQLQTSLYKLERIHQEVEMLRSRQDSKSLIITLDSEIRVLNAQLAEFEEKKCDKQRLLTKKSASSTLLKEERFRKQMQTKFASKLEQLATLLRKWKQDEGSSFDQNLLSDEVRAVLQNSDNTDLWVEQRTEFMHLRTVRAKRSTKRVNDDEDVAKSEEDAKRPSRRTKPPTETGLTVRNNIPEPAVPSTRKRGASSKRIDTDERESNSKPAKIPRTKEAPPKSPLKKGRVKTAHTRRDRLPLSPTQSQPPKRTSNRLTLPPFGHVLEQAFSPKQVNNENESSQDST